MLVFHLIPHLWSHSSHSPIQQPLSSIFMCLFSPHAIYLHILVDKKTMRHHLYKILQYTLRVLGYRVSPYSSLSHRAFIFSYVPIVPLTTDDPNLTMALSSHVTLRGLRSDSLLFLSNHFFSLCWRWVLLLLLFWHLNASILYYFFFSYWKFSVSILEIFSPHFLFSAFPGLLIEG